MIDTTYDDASTSAETQELIESLKSFGQGGEYADPTTDTGFKHLLSPTIEENEEIIKSFLNTFVPDFEHDPVKKVINDITAVPRLPQDGIKQTFMDMHVIARSGSHYIIEMQAQRHIHFDERALYYTAATYSQQISEEAFRDPMWYRNLNPTIAIQVLGFDTNRARGIGDKIADSLIERVKNNPLQDNQFMKHYVMTDKHSGQEIRHLQMIQIELPRAKKNVFPPNKDFSITDWWLSIFKFAPQYTQKKIIALEKKGIVMPPVIAQALHRLYFPKWNPKEIHEYKTDTIEKEKYAFEFASERTEGKAEGEVIGEAKGKVEGKAELLIKQLEVKFGILLQNYIERITSADLDKLSQWGINFIHAQSLEAVFED